MIEAGAHGPSLAGSSAYDVDGRYMGKRCLLHPHGRSEGRVRRGKLPSNASIWTLEGQGAGLLTRAKAAQAAAIE